MKVLICTPAYGGILTANYFLSFLNMSQAASEEGITMGSYVLKNYSDVAGARNLCASTVLRDGWDYGFFIDADQVWQWEHASALIRSERQLCGGTYPLKRLPIELNFLPLTKDEEQFRRGRTPAQLQKLVSAEGNEAGELQVRALPGGFLLVSRGVFEELAKTSDTYTDRTTGEPQTCWEFFSAGKTAEGDRLTEDYNFCVKAAAAGYDIWLNTKAIVGHEGSYLFMARY